jgi:hypothetical protein
MVVGNRVNIIRLNGRIGVETRNVALFVVHASGHLRTVSFVLQSLSRSLHAQNVLLPLKLLVPKHHKIFLASTLTLIFVIDADYFVALEAPRVQHFI